MNIVILGAGSIGSYLADTLSQEEHNVIVIDCDPKALEKISRSADVATRLGSGTDWQLLEDLMEHAPDLFIAMSSDDETNLVACTIAKNLGYPKTVARVHQMSYLNRSRLDFEKLFFIDHFIGTELIVAHDLFKCIINPGNVAVENFAHGAVQMRTIIIPEHFRGVGKKIANLNLADNLLVGLVRRKTEGSNTIIFPRGSDVLLPGDEVTLVGETKVMLELHDVFGIAQKKVRSVVMVGGTSMALHIANLLNEQGIELKIIEKNDLECRKLAESLPHTMILNQDGTDPKFLASEKVSHADVFVACTYSHETNILSAMLAKEAGCEDVVALVSDASFTPLLKKFGIAYTLSEKVSISDRIHSILYDDALISVASLYDNQVKILEIKVSTDSQIVGIPISDLNSVLPQNFIIALIENRGRIMVAKGSNIVSPGDTVIVICSPKHISELKTIF